MAAAKKRTLYKRNSQYIVVYGLTDKSVTPNTYANTATGQGTLYNAVNEAVAGATAIDALYVDASNGEYRFPIDPVAFDPPVGSGYKFKVTLTEISGATFDIELPCEVKVRQEGTEL